MSCTSCGCATQPCGCCAGVAPLTPAAVRNRPGLPALSYRVGTHAQFLQTMQARLSTMTVEALTPDGKSSTTFRPLQGLTTRDPGDPSIALLDAWATVGDVLTFYQERIANEAYLRTATERRSVLELARLVGYTLRPGVAASVYLAYTLDDNQKDPVTIAAGARSQSVPAPGEQAQSFETSEDLAARREWNNLQVRLTQPQNITFDNALGIESINVAGVNTNLKPGDKLLLAFSDDGAVSVVRSVAAVDTQFAGNRTAISLQPLGAALLSCAPLLSAFLNQMTPLFDLTVSSAASRALLRGEDFLRQLQLGVPSRPATWVAEMKSAADEPLPAVLDDALAALETQITSALALAGGAADINVTDPAVFVKGLLTPPVPQVRNSASLARSLAQAFVSPTDVLASSGKGQGLQALEGAAPLRRIATDAGTQLLVNFVPHLEPSYYAAWAGAQLNATPPALKGVFAFRTRAALFGAAAPKLPAYTAAGVLEPQNQWTDWNYDADEAADNAFLDQADDAVVPGSFALVDVAGERQLLHVAQASSSPRTAYGLSGPSTRLSFDSSTANWRSVSSGGDALTIAELRKTQVYARSEPLTLVDETLTGPVGTPKASDADRATPEQVQLDGLYDGLVSGRWVIFSGERADIESVSGVTVSELQMISGVAQGFDPALPGDQVHTTLTLAKGLAYQYKRATLTVYGNVVAATHGETRNEALGSGDGARSLQSFTLKQPPLTFVAAPTAAGAQSTLHVYVNDVEWHETDTLAWLGPKDRGFATLTDDAGSTTLTFGNGAHGKRLPTGVQNVAAVYRNGIGSGGNVDAGQVSLLQTRPLGVKAVVNPLRASGGADAESRDLARENAPLSVMSLDRLVSVQDYADFTRGFAGIAKSLAMLASDGRHALLYLTVAGVADIPIDPSSDLYRNLLDALRMLGDADLPLRVDLRDLKALVLSAKLKLLPDYRWEAVAAAVRAELLDAFGFDRRALGQPVLLSEVIAAVQGVPGVAYVDVDAFGAVPEKVTKTHVDSHGVVTTTRELLDQADIAQAVLSIVDPSTAANASNQAADRLPASVDAWPGGPDHGPLRPAELAVFMPAVPDTLVLNQIP